MMSKSVSMQSSIRQSPGSSMRFQIQPNKMSKYQQQMKQHYEQLELRAQENYKKDREIVDHLNRWDYCNPDNNQDQLPMPYLAIDEIIQDGIIKEVLNKIGDIEKQKQDPNYDGQLKVIYPQGDVITPSGITAIAEAQGNPSKHLVMGDKFGNVYVFDQSKKSIITKFDQLPRKRIIHISAVHMKLIDSHITTIAIIQRAQNKVSILRYVDGENVLNIQSTITVSQLTKTAGQSANEFVYESILSLNSTYLALLHYSGNVSLYNIPEPPLQKVQVQIDAESQVFIRTEDSNQSLTSLNKNQASPRYELSEQNYKLPVYTQKDLPDLKPYYIIEFKGKKREKKYSEIMKEIQKSNDVLRSSLLGITVDEMYAQIAAKQAAAQQPPQQQPPPAPVNQKKDVKKPGGKDDKKEESAKQVQLQQQQQQQPPDFLKNKDVLFGQDRFEQVQGDTSEDINIPFYRPKVVFLSEKVTFSNKDKQFNRPFTQEIVTGLVVTWYNSKNFQYHKLNESSFENLTQQQQYKFTRNDNFQNVKPPSFKSHMIQNFSLIYSITSMEMCESQKYIGFGLKDGNIILWDNEFQVEKKSLQCHSSSISCIRFFYEKFLVSGCNNGQIFIHSLEKDDKFVSLSNKFNVLKQNPILNIQINKYGLIYALDSRKNLRTYNIHLGQKIANLQPKLSYDKIEGNQASDQQQQQQQSKYQISWSINPLSIFHISKVYQLIFATFITSKQVRKQVKYFFQKDGDQLYVLNEEINTEQVSKFTEDQKQAFLNGYQKTGIVQIFKLSDNLSTIYDGIRNLLRNGIEKDKMSRQDLDNKEYSLAQVTQYFTENQTISSKNNSTILPRFSKINKSSIYSNRKTIKSQTNLKILEKDLTNNLSANISSIKNPILPSISKLKEGFLSPSSDVSSVNSARRSTNFKNISQVQGLTEQKLHPERYLWKSQYESSQLFDPLNNTLIKARDRISRQHILEESLNKSMIILEKNLKAKEDEMQMRVDLEKKRLLRESILQTQEKNKKKKKKQ